MDYSMLMGVEVTFLGDSQRLHTIEMALPTQSLDVVAGFAPQKKWSINALTEDRETRKRSGTESKQKPEVGELISRQHCFQYGYQIYHLSIIDYLQEWNAKKKMERFAKTVLLSKDGKKLSAIEPN